MEDPDSHMAHYVILRGIDRFFTEYNTYPGHFDERLEPDIVELKVKSQFLLVIILMEFLSRAS